MIDPQTNMLEYKLQPEGAWPWCSYLNHLVGIGVVESQLSEGSTAGWEGSNQTRQTRQDPVCAQHLPGIQ